MPSKVPGALSSFREVSAQGHVKPGGEETAKHSRPGSSDPGRSTSSHTRLLEGVLTPEAANTQGDVQKHLTFSEPQFPYLEDTQGQVLVSRVFLHSLQNHDFKF